MVDELRKKEIEEAAQLVAGFSEELTNRLLKMSDEEFKSWKKEHTEDVLMPNLNKNK